MNRKQNTVLSTNEVKSNFPRVAVMATVSAGKSTFINALLGTELLHSANEATTAKLVTIKQPKQELNLLLLLKDLFCKYQPKFLTEITTPKGTVQYENNACPSLLRDLNQDKTIRSILLTGQIKAAPKYNVEIAFIDTPGPNNSMEFSHNSETLSLLNETQKYSHIFYILNATQFAINDDYHFLKKIAEKLAKNEQHQIYFFLNKADQLDPEKGETISNLVSKAKKYLLNIGFKYPVIIPFSASVILACQKALLGEKLTRQQKYSLIQRIEFSKNEDWINLSKISPNILKNAQSNIDSVFGFRKIKITDDNIYSTKELKQVMLTSGLAVVEQLIKQEIMKDF